MGVVRVLANQRLNRNCSLLQTSTPLNDQPCQVPHHYNIGLRKYTPIPLQPNTLSFLIKRYEGGRVSGYLHELQAGDSLEVEGPQVRPALEGIHPNLCMIAGGTGIAPMLQRLMLPQQHNFKKTWLLNLNWTTEDVCLLDVITRVCAERGVEFRNHVGRIFDRSMLEEFELPAELSFLVCGPPPMMQHVMGSEAEPGLLRQWGYNSLYRC